MTEPVLRAEDRRAWDAWMKAAGVHASTLAFQRHVDSAKRVVDVVLRRSHHPACAWSGGKDSTCMAYLIVAEMGAREVVLVSEKDDLDYPGEEGYVTALAAAWKASLRVVRPPVSLDAWVAEHAATMLPGDDIHSRSAALAKTFFYEVMEEAMQGHDAVMLGLRAEESGTRRALRSARGRVYALRGQQGRTRGLPIADWKGIDVYAYALSRGFELLPVYRCIGFAHATKPWLVRKSWWLPGSMAGVGQVAWLRRYYPSLYRRLCEVFPEATQFA